jgi:hypothetical protein
MNQLTLDLRTAQSQSAPPADVMRAPTPPLAADPFDSKDLSRRPIEVSHRSATLAPGICNEAVEAKTVLFRDPQEVLAHPTLVSSEKRALLASWASDACAVENLPNWRRLPETGTLVPLDEILDALQALDSGALH